MKELATIEKVETIVIGTESEEMVIHFQNIPAFCEEYQAEIEQYKVTSLDDIANINKNKEILKELKKYKREIEEFRKEKKSFYLQSGREIDATAKQLMSLIDPLLEQAENNAKFAEKQAELALLNLTRERHAILTEKGIEIVSAVSFGKMSEIEFNEYLEMAGFRKYKQEQEKLQQEKEQQEQQNKLIAEQAEKLKQQQEQQALEAEKKMLKNKKVKSWLAENNATDDDIVQEKDGIIKIYRLVATLDINA